MTEIPRGQSLGHAATAVDGSLVCPCPPIDVSFALFRSVILQNYAKEIEREKMELTQELHEMLAGAPGEGGGSARLEHEKAFLVERLRKAFERAREAAFERGRWEREKDTELLEMIHHDAGKHETFGSHQMS